MKHLNNTFRVSRTYQKIPGGNFFFFCHGSDSLGIVFSPNFFRHSMVVEMVPLKGGIGSMFHPPEGKDYKWYISGIYCQLGDYMLPTTF